MLLMQQLRFKPLRGTSDKAKIRRLLQACVHFRTVFSSAVGASLTERDPFSLLTSIQRRCAKGARPLFLE